MDGGGYGDAAAFAVGWAVQPLPHPNPIHSSTLEEKRDRDAAAAARASERGLAVALGCGGRGRVHTASPPSVQIISPLAKHCNQGFDEFKHLIPINYQTNIVQLFTPIAKINF